MRIGGGEIGRWLFFAVILLACIWAYFVLARRTEPVVRPVPAATAP